MIALALALASTAATPTADLKADEILARCQKAYDAAKTFQEDATGGLKGTQAIQVPSKGTAHILFMRPDKLRVTGTTMFGSKYDLVANGNKISVLNAGVWSEMSSLSQAVAAITGISANTGTHVPAALFHLKFGALNQMKGGSPTVKMETLPGGRAYKLSSSSPFPTSLWIDAKSFLMMRVTNELSGRTLAVDLSRPIINGKISASSFKKP